MDKTILQDLLHVDKVPKVIRDMDNGMETLRQVIARAADEIERLQKENKKLKKKLKRAITY